MPPLNVPLRIPLFFCLLFSLAFTVQALWEMFFENKTFENNKMFLNSENDSELTVLVKSFKST